MPPQRLLPWFSGFVRRNGEITAIRAEAGQTVVETARGACARLPQQTVDAAGVAELVAAVLGPGTAVVVLVRRGGYSVARVRYDGPGHEVLASKSGTRYVQGRTAAGGQSQQRFARRRQNQATALAQAATAAVATVLGESPAPVELLVTGGDAALLQEVLSAAPLRRLTAARTVHVPVGEPRRRTIDEAVVAARSVPILVTNAGEEDEP